MSKIIGNPIGTTLPKPDFKQTDPTKGDYIKNKPEVTDAAVGELLAIKTIDEDGHITKLEGVEADTFSKSGHIHDDRYYTESEINAKFSSMVGDTPVATQISAAINSIPQPEEGVFYVTVTDNGDETYSADKTLMQLKEACDNGKILFCRLTFNDIPINLPIVVDQMLPEVALFGAQIDNMSLGVNITNDAVAVIVREIATSDEIPTDTSQLQMILDILLTPCQILQIIITKLLLTTKTVRL